MKDNEVQAVAQRLEGSLGQILDRASVSSVFGAPTTQGGITVIPVADVWFGVGYGYGRGLASSPAHDTSTGGDPEAETVESAPGEGSGAGGGGGGRARAVGIVRITEKGANFEPFVDPARLALGGMVLTAWVVFWLGLMVRSVARTLARKGG